MKRTFVVLAGLAIMAGGSGCSTNDQPTARQANSAESAPYAPGTGVSSSSFDRHPRFYTGANDDPAQAPTTQPASGQ